ncbi:MAG: hypothetical protein CMJ65_12015 [Planctomycetaceae bacterium]|mgnify:CR=1 FL=1|nr:hypothetical protein [Planctomycetaceae bacterium]MDP7275847.1 CNNM domain-containing protein [Planctomycetaceae bacterium]
MQEIWLPGCLAMTGLILASGFFSSSETALFFLSREDLRAFRVGRRRQQLVTRLLADPDRLLTAVLFWNLLINLTFFSVSIVLAGKLSEGNPVTAAAFSLSSVVVIILFGEVLPKSIAVLFRRRLALWLAWPLTIAVRVFDPLAPAFLAITKLLHRAFWPHVIDEPTLDAEDLEQAVENSERTTEVIRQERQVLHNILDLGEISVEEVMRPRGTWTTATVPVRLSDLDATAIETGFVVLSNGDDAVEKVIPLDHRSTLTQEHLEQLSEDVIPVPWCANLAFVLQRMRETFAGVASVVNEYGETIGVVTYDDILDTILSPEPSRARRLLRREPVQDLGDGKYEVEALTTLRYLAKRLNVEFEPDPERQVTVGGLLQEQLERMPVVGDECIWQGYRIRVMETSGRGPRKVVVAPQQGLTDPASPGGSPA